MMNNFCCQDFRSMAERGWAKEEDGKWSITSDDGTGHVVDVNFCPSCGRSVKLLVAVAVPSNSYEDERHCEHCDKDTPHVCRDTTHERDSSGDYQECKVCGWYSIGHSKYFPPLKDVP